MDIDVNGRKLRNLTKINVLLGKNGTGKSVLLRHFEQHKKILPDFGTARYITPERGGELVYEGGVETNSLQNSDWGDNVRRSNRYYNFRQLSVTQFRRLETLVLRKIEKDVETRKDAKFSFDTTLASINELLDHVELVRGDSVTFDIQTKGTDKKREPTALSSGETELISLAIEILAFAFGADTHKGKKNYLFLDEPDVHLHPDLQERLVKLLVNAIRNRDIVVVIATHSTAILGALTDNEEASVGFISAKQTEVQFTRISETLRKVLPIFGAHPLSNVFNQNPIFLVEGEDDERIWQQAVRSSQGDLRIWPCPAGDIQSLEEYENQVEAIASAVYENATAYSLRDRDSAPYEIDDKKIVKRMRLFCRAAENLLVSDDVLRLLDTDWEKMKDAIEDWISKYPKHPQYAAMNAFKTGGYDRRNCDLKPLCNILMMLAGSRKPWEVVVGQAIACLLTGPNMAGEHSLTAFLGPKLVKLLNLRPPAGFRLLRSSKRSPD
jgi:ABC-type multidrug transport system ATPase subunit